MARGRKSIVSIKNSYWEKAFYDSIGYYITIINNGLNKNFKSEPLSNHIKIIGGFAFKNVEYKSSGIPIIRISDFNNEKIVLNDVVYYEESQSLSKYELKESDIIIALTGGTIGKLGIVQAGLGKLYLNQRVGKFDILKPGEFEKEYIYWIARGIEGIVKTLAWGAAIPNVSPKQIEELNFPIPSKDIQMNIIRFLNDLKNQSLRDSEYFDLEVEGQIKRTQNHLVKILEVQKELTHQLTLIEQLNQAILQEAVQGKLVPQNAADEPAAELLKRIKAEKAKTGKKEKQLPPIKPEEIPFEIPDSWVWCRLGDICTIKGGKRVSNGYKLLKEPTPHIYIRVSDMKNGSVDDSDLHYLDESMFQKIKQYTISKDDIYMTIVGGTIGKCGLIPDKFHNMNLTENAAKISPIIINKIYLWKCLDSPFCQDQFIDKTKQVGVQKMALSRFSSSIIPLPPLAEQKRIVAEIEKQLAKTKQLKEHVLANQQATEQLLKALLHQAFEVKEETSAKPYPVAEQDTVRIAAEPE